MQFLVRVTGDISDSHKKAYIIKSDTEENAQLLAAQCFCNEYNVEGRTVIVEPYRRTNKAIMAFAFMLVPILLSMIGWKDGHNTINIRPDFISCLYGVLIYAAFIVRFKGIQRTVGSWIDILSVVFSVLLLAAFVKMILVVQNISIFGLTDISIDTNVILFVAIVLSWLGVKIVSVVCMAFVVIFAFVNIIALNNAMGMFYGSLYVICSFVGIMLYLSIEPACIDAKYNFTKAVLKGLNVLGNDITQAKKKAISYTSETARNINEE